MFKDRSIAGATKVIPLTWPNAGRWLLNNVINETQTGSITIAISLKSIATLLRSETGICSSALKPPRGEQPFSLGSIDRKSHCIGTVITITAIPETRIATLHE